MSRKANYRYEMEKQRRREIHLSRVRETTRGLIEKYRSQQHDLVKQFTDVIPAELQKLESVLNQAESLLVSDAEAARKLSVAIGSHICSLFRLGRKVRQRLEAQERAVANLFDEFLRQIADPIVRDFALEEIVALKNDLAQSTPEAGIEDSLRTRLVQITHRAENQAAQWKAEQIAHAGRESQLEQITQLRENLRAEADENPAQLKRIIDQLDATEHALQSGSDAQAEIANQIQQIVEQADEAVSDELVRREVVHGVIKALREAGFEVESPERFTDGGEDIVQVVARKPSGPQAEVKIHLDGAFAYHFDRYQGSACKKDISSFTSRLQDIYGVKLSDERVTWENPDRLTETAKPLPTSEEHRHG